MFLDCEGKSTDMNGDTLEMKVKEVVICVEKWNPGAIFLRDVATATSEKKHAFLLFEKKTNYKIGLIHL